MVERQMRRVHEEIEERVKPNLDEVIKLRLQLAKLQSATQLQAAPHLSHGEGERDSQSGQQEPGLESPSRSKGSKAKMETGQLLARSGPRSDSHRVEFRLDTHVADI